MKNLKFKLKAAYHVFFFLMTYQNKKTHHNRRDSERIILFHSEGKIQREKWGRHRHIKSSLVSSSKEPFYPKQTKYRRHKIACLIDICMALR